MPKTNKNASKKKLDIRIIIAIIGLVGATVTAVFANWDKLFAQAGKNTEAAIPTHMPENEAKAREIAIDIIGVTYRRAFALNFTTRFVNREEYLSVLNSIRETHGAVQARYVKLAALKTDHATIVYNMLRKLDLMETTFTGMERFIDDNDHSKGYSPRRLDGTGPPELTKKFRDMESVRIQYLEDIRQLADRVDLVLPDVPAQIPEWGK